ncbi:MAG: pilin [Patescibacteria group bacterium]|nr:pilin [Patescibacteria group bacterium]
MSKKILKNLVVFAMLSLLALPIVTMAQSNLDVGMNEIEEGFGDNGLGNTDPRTTVARLINVAMLFLGIIAVVIILLGGFKWMTAGGNEDKVGEAKKLMGAGVVGLVIVLSAWGIANFILGRLITATN